MYREKRFSLTSPVAISDYVAHPTFPEIPPLSIEEEAALDEEMRVVEVARQQQILRQQQDFLNQLETIRKRVR